MSLVNRYGAGEIIIAIQERRGGCFPIQDLLECKLNGIKVTDSAAFFERERGQIRVNSLYPSWLVFGGGFDQSLLRSGIKRVFDLAASGVLLVVTLPSHAHYRSVYSFRGWRPYFLSAGKGRERGENIYGAEVPQYEK